MYSEAEIGAPENLLASRDQIHILASISANFSRIFKYFLLLKAYKKGLSKTSRDCGLGGLGASGAPELWLCL